MGVFVWVATAILTVVLVRLVCAVTHNKSWRPSLIVAVIGAVVGGYALDLTIKGDSVTHFHGPSLAGALIGVIVVLGLSFAFAWLATLHRHTPAG